MASVWTSWELQWSSLMESFSCLSRRGSCIQYHFSVELPSVVVFLFIVVLLNSCSYPQVYTEPFWADKQTLNEERRSDWIYFHQLASHFPNYPTGKIFFHHLSSLLPPPSSPSPPPHSSLTPPPPSSSSLPLSFISNPLG